MRGCLLGFLSCLVPTVIRSQRITQKVYISYKTDWPISSGFLLTLITYINPLFLSMLATWLGIFFSRAGHILLLLWSGQGWRESFLLPRILLFSLPRLYFLSGWPAYTSCLSNQHLFKPWLTEYRQFSYTRDLLISSNFLFVFSISLRDFFISSLKVSIIFMKLHLKCFLLLLLG